MLEMASLPWAYACLCVFLAAIVRGYSGFGFSLLSITALSIMFAPAEIMPSIFMLEIAASLHLLPSVWKDIHWPSLMPLIIGCLIATPIGVWLLANIAAAPMQLAISIFVLIAAGLMAMGFALKSMPGRIASTVVGAASGLANGAFGMAGPPVVLFYFASPAGHVAGRASLIAFFLSTDVIGLANQAPHGLVTTDSAIRAAAFLPAMLAGNWLGARGFKSANTDSFRRWVLLLLAVLALIVGIRALLRLQV
jgi:uncharacterized protein